MKLCELMKTISPEEVTVRRAIPLAMRVAVVLYKLGSSAEYRLIANQFGVHKSTVTNPCKPGYCETVCLCVCLLGYSSV